NERLALVSNQLAGVKRSLGKIEEAIAHEKQADQFTPDDPLYHWMLGLRLKNLGMNVLAEKHFQRAIQLDPKFQSVFKLTRICLTRVKGALCIINKPVLTGDCVRRISESGYRKPERFLCRGLPS